MHPDHDTYYTTATLADLRLNTKLMEEKLVESYKERARLWGSIDTLGGRMYALECRMRAAEQRIPDENG